MSRLVGEKINNFVIEYVKGDVYYLRQLDNELNYVAIDMKSKKVVNSRRNGRNYKSSRFLKKYNYLIDLLSYTIRVDSLYNPSVEVKSQRVFRSPFAIVQNILECGRI